MQELHKIGFTMLIFSLGLYFCLNNRSYDMIEGFSTSNCPNLLVQKDGKYYLRNTRKAMIPGVNPIQFDSLGDYIEFTKWQRGQGIRCPVLFAQETNDAQGGLSYRLQSDVLEPENGLPSNLNDLETKLYDAGRDRPIYNKNSLPSYDPMGQYIGAETPLDKMFKESTNGPTANAMDTQWGGSEFSRNVVDKGAYLQRTRAEDIEQLQPNKVRGELFK